MSHRSDERPVDEPDAPGRPHDAFEDAPEDLFERLFSRGPGAPFDVVDGADTAANGNGYASGSPTDGSRRAETDDPAASADPSDRTGRADAPRTAFSRPAGQGGDDTVRQLLMLQSSAGDLQKPYLRALPQTYAAELVVFDWLTYLLYAVGFRGTIETLRYYESIDWIADGVERDLTEYLLGFASNEADRPDEPEPVDHRRSLVYLAQLVSLD